MGSVHVVRLVRGNEDDMLKVTLVRVHAVRAGDRLTDGEVLEVKPAPGGLVTMRVRTDEGFVFHMTRTEGSYVNAVTA